MARVVAEGVPHHITQRGNNRQDVFLLAEDRRSYLKTLRERCRDHDVALLGYCLMTNHVHLVAVPARADSLALALGRCHGSYARRFNKRYRRSGHLWQNRFYSCALGGSHVAAALAYVDLNPVRAGLVRRAEEWEWSSARGHAGGVDFDGLIDAWQWSELGFGEVRETRTGSIMTSVLTRRSPSLATCRADDQGRAAPSMRRLMG